MRNFIIGIIIGAIMMYVGLWVWAGYTLVETWEKICPTCSQSNEQ